MGAGVSQKQITRIKYRELQKVRIKLQMRGVDARYDKRTRTVVCTTPGDAEAFWIGFGFMSRASNGECYAPLVVSVVDRETGERRFYEGADYRKGIDHVVRDYAKVGA